MKKLKNLKKIHRSTKEIKFSKIWEEGIFVFDSNVLLDLYRLPKSTSDDLIRVLNKDKFNDRIWIGFQVILEFLNNRYATISDQKSKFTEVRNLVNNSISKYEGIYSELINDLNDLKLKERHSLIDPEEFINSENKESGVKHLYDFIEDIDHLEKKQVDVNDHDKIKNIVLKTFKSKIGSGFESQKLQEIYKEGEARYADSIPPGYKDAGKKGAHQYEDKEYIRKYGDLILWHEIIEKVKIDKIKYLVLITSDLKEDWWFQKRGKKLGPRFELLNEIYYKAPSLDTFYMYDTSSFLKNAKKELNLNINKNSISNIENLIKVNKFQSWHSQIETNNIMELLKSSPQRFSDLTILYSPSLYELPQIRLNASVFYNVIMEIYSNVSNHSLDKSVIVKGEVKNDKVLLSFSNKRKGESYFILNDRHKGLQYVKSILELNNVNLNIKETDSWFVVELYFPCQMISQWHHTPT